jgi:hypothetical protein
VRANPACCSGLISPNSYANTGLGNPAAAPLSNPLASMLASAMQEAPAAWINPRRLISTMLRLSSTLCRSTATAAGAALSPGYAFPCFGLHSTHSVTTVPQVLNPKPRPVTAVIRMIGLRCVQLRKTKNRRAVDGPRCARYRCAFSRLVDAPFVRSVTTITLLPIVALLRTPSISGLDCPRFSFAGQRSKRIDPHGPQCGDQHCDPAEQEDRDHAEKVDL